MSRQVVLLRVGIDAGCGSLQGPIFEDDTFEFMCIPDNKGVSVHTYGNMVGRNYFDPPLTDEQRQVANLEGIFGVS